MNVVTQAFFRGALPAVSLAGVVISLLAAHPAIASPTDEALAALQSGDLDRAILLAKPLAEQGNPVAQRLMGKALMRSPDVSQRPSVVPWLEKAASQGDAESEYLLGAAYDRGGLAQPDPPKAFSLYLRSARRGYAPAQTALAMCFENGVGTSRDLGEARTWFQKAADQGYAWGQFAMGRFYHFGLGIKRDDQEAVRWLRRAADQGLSAAEGLLADMYVAGDGVDRDIPQGVRLYLSAANKGNAIAQERLGLHYMSGDGLPKDTREAVYWLRKSAEQSFAPAQFHLALAYAQGTGIDQDMEQAIAWYRKAAEQGDIAAQNNLGSIYHSGVSSPDAYPEAVKWYRRQNDLDRRLFVKRDYAEAKRWFVLAARGGNYLALKNLSVMYLNGQGVEKDLVQAHTLATLARSRSPAERDPVVASQLASLKADIEANMSPSDIALANERARTWTPESLH